MIQRNDPNNSLPHHLRGAFRGYEIALGRYLKRYNLPLSQFYILRLKWKEDGNRQTDIAAKSFMSESVAAQVIKKMSDRDLVRRKPDPEDNRAQLVYLTARGEALREKIVTEGIQISTENAPDIPRKDIIKTIEVLKKIREGFDLYNSQ